jgi:GT2 family glycosyltransferase
MPLVAPDDRTSPVDLSVVILNWNARDYLIACLDSILQQSWQSAIQLIVVDNASNLDDAVTVVRRDYPQAQLIANPVNVGFARGNNIGLKEARGRYVLFLNPDTVVHEKAFDILVQWMDEHPEVGACGPKLLNSDGSLQASCRAFPSIGAGFFRNTPLGRLWPNNPWTRSYLMENFAHDREASVDWLSGSALLVRREAIEQLVKQEGWAWDEKYFMYCEDVDLCYRLKQLGWPRMYVPHAVITHRIGASSDWAQGAMIRRFHASMLRFYFKHYARGWGLLLAPVAVLGIGLRAAGAVLKLYSRYMRMGRFGQMLKRKFGKA